MFQKSHNLFLGHCLNRYQTKHLEQYPNIKEWFFALSRWQQSNRCETGNDQRLPTCRYGRRLGTSPARRCATTPEKNWFLYMKLLCCSVEMNYFLYMKLLWCSVEMNCFLYMKLLCCSVEMNWVFLYMNLLCCSVEMKCFCTWNYYVFRWNKRFSYMKILCWSFY